MSDIPASTDPTGFWRFVFWLVYILGTLTLLLSFLLSQVPTPRGGDFRPDYATRSLAAIQMLISILLAKRIWKVKNPVARGIPRVSIELVVSVAWCELAIALCGVIGLAVSKH